MKQWRKRQVARAPNDHASRTSAQAIDFSRYVPAHITYLANKISSGATAIYLPRFGIGITEWRIMALLARDAWVAPKQVSEVTGIDKGAVSRALVALKAAGIADVRPDPYDRRGQVVALTRRGLRLHDRMVRLARERERILLSGLSRKERSLLVQLLARIESQLPLANAVSRESRGNA